MVNSHSGSPFSFSCSCKDAKAVSISPSPTSSSSFSSSYCITNSSSSTTPTTPSSSPTFSDLHRRHVAWTSTHSEVNMATHDGTGILHGHHRRFFRGGETCTRREVAGRRKVRESVAVVKETEDPVGDFRRSMIAMIVDKDMKTYEELRELLRWFLALNTPENHPLVLQAFADVWELEAFSPPGLSQHGPRRHPRHTCG